MDEASAPLEWAAIDSAQGEAVDRSIVVVTGSEGGSWLHSATSRGRTAPIYVVQDGRDA